MSNTPNKSGGIFSWYFQSNLLVRIFIGLILGAVFGIIFQNSPELSAFLKPFGDIFVRLLKMIMLPVVVCTLIVGASSISPSNLGRIGAKIIAFYLITSVFAIVVGLFVGSVIEPGAGLNLAGGTGEAKVAQSVSMVSTLVNIIPTNIFGSLTSGNVLPVICFCLFFGVALAFGRDSEDQRVKHVSEIVFDFFDGASMAIFKVVHWIMQYAPIGVFALIYVVFAKNGADAFGPLLSVTGSVYVGLFLQVAIVYTAVCIMIGLNPLRFLRKVRAPMLTAFVTRSSGGTLPVSIETADEVMGIKRSVYSFTLPIGATINMDGSTIYLGICAIFIANAVGVPLDFAQQLTIVLTAVLASIGTAGVPGAGAIMLLMVLESVGLKVEAGSAVAAAYGMILGIDAFLDMGRTAVNVTGDMAGALFVGKTEDEFDREIWDKD